MIIKIIIKQTFLKLQEKTRILMQRNYENRWIQSID